MTPWRIMVERSRSGPTMRRLTSTAPKSKTFQHSDAEVAALEVMAGRDDLPPKQGGPYVHFALAKALEDSGELFLGEGIS